MIYFEKERQIILELVKKIEVDLDLSGWDIKYEFDDEFHVYPYITRMFLSNELVPKDNIIKCQIKDGLYDYIKSLGIDDEYKYIASYIHSILHEFGHIHSIILVKNTDEAIAQLETINIVSKALLKDLEISDFNQDDIYKNSYVELYADKFAYKWFPIIWNKYSDVKNHFYSLTI